MWELLVLSNVTVTDFSCEWMKFFRIPYRDFSWGERNLYWRNVNDALIYCYQIHIQRILRSIRVLVARKNFIGVIELSITIAPTQVVDKSLFMSVIVCQTLQFLQIEVVILQTRIGFILLSFEVQLTWKMIF